MMSTLPPPCGKVEPNNILPSPYCPRRVGFSASCLPFRGNQIIFWSPVFSPPAESWPLSLFSLCFPRRRSFPHIFTVVTGSKPPARAPAPGGGGDRPPPRGERRGRGLGGQGWIGRRSEGWWRVRRTTIPSPSPPVSESWTHSHTGLFPCKCIIK